MIHDFAKSPRTYSLSNTEPKRAPVRVRRLPKGRWILVFFIVALVVVWRVSGLSRTPASDFVPGASESQEYERALEQQEKEAASEKARQAAAVSSSIAEQKRLMADLQAKLKQHASTEPEFGFYDSLSGSAWSVPVQTGVYVTEEDRKRASQRYMLQAASVRDLGEAQRIVQRLRQLGLQAFYSQDESGGWYRVNVGPFDNMSKLNKAEDILVSLRMMPLKKKI